jgi:hypothetical protein
MDQRLTRETPTTIAIARSVHGLSSGQFTTGLSGAGRARELGDLVVGQLPGAIIERSALISLVPAPRQVSRYPRTASRDRRAITTFYILNISL